MNELLHSLDWVLPLRSDQLTPLMRFFTLLGYEHHPGIKAPIAV